MGDADSFDAPFFGKIYSFLLGNGGTVRKLVAGDPSAAFYQADDFLGVAFGRGNIIQRISGKRVVERIFIDIFNIALSPFLV